MSEIKDQQTVTEATLRRTEMFTEKLRGCNGDLLSVANRLLGFSLPVKDVAKEPEKPAINSWNMRMIEAQDALEAECDTFRTILNELHRI